MQRRPIALLLRLPADRSKLADDGFGCVDLLKSFQLGLFGSSPTLEAPKKDKPARSTPTQPQQTATGGNVTVRAHQRRTEHGVHQVRQHNRQVAPHHAVGSQVRIEWQRPGGQAGTDTVHGRVTGHGSPVRGDPDDVPYRVHVALDKPHNGMREATGLHPDSVTAVPEKEQRVDPKVIGDALRHERDIGANQFNYYADTLSRALGRTVSASDVRDALASHPNWRKADDIVGGYRFASSGRDDHNDHAALLDVVDHLHRAGRFTGLADRAEHKYRLAAENPSMLRDGETVKQAVDRHLGRAEAKQPIGKPMSKARPAFIFMRKGGGWEPTPTPIAGAGDVVAGVEVEPASLMLGKRNRVERGRFRIGPFQFTFRLYGLARTVKIGALTCTGPSLPTPWTDTIHAAPADAWAKAQQVAVDVVQALQAGRAPAGGVFLPIGREPL